MFDRTKKARMAVLGGLAALPLLAAVPAAALTLTSARAAERPAVGDCNHVIMGTEGDDVIKAYKQPSHLVVCTVVYALGGDDVILGSAGVDYIFAGGGNDQVDAGDGDDVVWGGTGDDRIYGGGGEDSLYGFAGDDAFNGLEPGFDPDAPDHIEGGTGHDCSDAEPVDVHGADVEAPSSPTCWF